MAHNVEEFRYYLQRTIKQNEDSVEAYNRGIASALRAVLIDFNELFPTEVWQGNKELRELVDKRYSHNKSKCPICDKHTILRTYRDQSNKTNTFYGCSRFPECRGSRHLDGRPTLNDALKLHLSSALNNEKQIVKAKTRFDLI